MQTDPLKSLCYLPGAVVGSEELVHSACGGEPAGALAVEADLNWLLTDSINTNFVGPRTEEDNMLRQHYYKVNKRAFIAIRKSL